jgi:lon-related putative ATP-dependent protease
MDKTRKALAALLEEVPRWQKKVREELRTLARDTAAAAVRHVMEELRALWADEKEVLAHLDALERDVLDNADDFLKSPDAAAESKALGPPERRYQVNVLVDNGETVGAPVVSEEYPTHANLVGRVEHLQVFGALVTDLHLMKAGALHRANGGYLLLDARAVLSQPFSWEALKRALRSREMRLESPAQSLGLMSTVSLEPEAVPLDVKVVLFGERAIFELLDRLDPDVRLLFKVLVDFEDEIPRTPENCRQYARLLAALAQKERIAPLSKGAVGRLIEESSRHAGEADKLSTHVLEAFDLVREAAHAARERGADIVDGEDVERAVESRLRRSGRVRERLLEETLRGTMLVDTAGERVGQINGLSVIEIGRVMFGRPMRITAKTRLGRGEVVDIEREVELGGPLHSKGVLILSSFLSARYAPDHPLSLAATLAFEQSYGMVEGDSASCAELCALLSALAGAPIRQSWAMTGSVNQHGEVQAIGGVNEKIEGFFDLCAARGLTGEQGCIIPAANVRHLMLRDDVVRAVSEGKFRVVAVDDVDQAMELLTGLEAGERGAGGRFAEGSLNARVEARLVALATRRIEIGRFDKS